MEIEMRFSFLLRFRENDGRKISQVVERVLMSSFTEPGVFGREGGGV